MGERVERIAMLAQKGSKGGKPLKASYTALLFRRQRAKSEDASQDTYGVSGCRLSSAFVNLRRDKCHEPREIRRESAEVRAGRIIEEEMWRRCLLSTAE